MPQKMKTYQKLLIVLVIFLLLYLSKDRMQNRYLSTLPYIALQHEGIAQEITFKEKKCRTANDAKLLMKETEEYITAAHHRYDRAAAQIMFPVRIPSTVEIGCPYEVKEFEFSDIKNIKHDSIAYKTLPAKNLIFEGVIMFNKDTLTNVPLLGYCLFADRHGHTICQSTNVIYIKSSTAGKECYYANRRYRFRTSIANTKELADLHHVVFVSKEKHLAAKDF
jgi:hypothetical protein